MRQTVQILNSILSRRIKNIQLHAGYILISLIFIIAVVIMFGNRTNIYSVKGTTQALTIETTKADINEWYFESGTLVAEDLFMEPIILSPERQFEFSASAKMRVSTINSPDRNKILITARHPTQTGTLTNGEEVTKLTGYVELLITISSDLVLPFEGNALMGEDVGRGVESILLDGEVSILESRFLSSGRYQGETYTLDTGDRAAIVDVNDEYISKGFIRATGDNSFYFSVVSEGDGVQVTRFGNEDLLLTPSKWSRVTKDPIVAAITSLFALMFLLLELALLIKQTIKNKD